MEQQEKLYKIKEECLDGYKITKYGKIWSTYNKKFIKIKNVNGYEILTNKRGNYLVHRLVAKTFIKNPDSKPYINHIDEDKTNNYYKNLEWVTQKENTEKHSKEISHERKVVCLDKDTKKKIKIYNSITEAANENNITRRAIQHVLNGTNQTAGGFKWKYKNKDNKKDNIDITDGKLIYDYDNYYIFSDGRIYNTSTKKLLKHVKNAAGRYYVTLCKDRNKKNYYVQVLVADHFLDNKPNNKSIVLHIDGNLENNNIDNLKWGSTMKTKTVNI